MRSMNEVIANPSGFDSLSNYIGETDFPEMFCVLTRNRDSDKLTRSNFDIALTMLGGESDNVQIDRFGHWACGWWESLSVKRDTPEFKIAEDIQASLADYPILDESHYSELEWTEASEYWERMSKRERIEVLNRFDVSIFAARRDEMPDNDSGSLFQYLASDC